MLEHEHRRAAELLVLEVFIAALAQDVERQDGALPGIDPVGERAEGSGFMGPPGYNTSVCHAVRRSFDPTQVYYRRIALALPYQGIARLHDMKLWIGNIDPQTTTTTCASC